MACNDEKVKGGSQSGSVDLDSSPKRKKHSPRKNASFADSLSKETIGCVPTPDSQFIFRKINPTLVQVTICLAVYLGVGSLCFYNLGHQMKGKKTNAIIDTVYFCTVTMATVGYGDLVPDSTLAKLLACAFAFTGMALIALGLNKATDYLMKRQEDLLLKALHMDQDDAPTENRMEVKTKEVKFRIFLVLVLILVLVFIGTTFLVTVEKMSIIDAFYCVCVTITTLGYGDQSFQTRGGRIFAVFWILISTLTLGQLFVYIAELNTETRQRKLVEQVLRKKMTKSDLEAADLDQDNSVQTAEFILYKLREMGKISKDDVALLKKFKHCDVDQPETLTVADIMSESSPTDK